MSRPVGPLDAARAALDARDGGPAAANVTVVAGPPDRIGSRLLLREGEQPQGTLGDPAVDEAGVSLAREVLEAGAPATREIEAIDTRWMLFAEPARATEELVVVGAGHIAVPLARLGVLLGFRTVVLDDREEFATAERFPTEARVVRADFSDPFRDVRITPRSYLVLVTRAHKYDYDCLKRLVEREARPRYIGMIGSRRRVKAAFHALLEGGVPRERLAEVRAPVGLEIGAETPEEIALSIAAEMVAVRRGVEGIADHGSRTAEAISKQENVLERMLPNHG